MRGGDPPEGSPVNSVGSEPNCSVEHQTVSRLLHRTISKHGAVQNVFRNIRIASNDNPSLAQAESHKPLGSTGLRRRSNPVVGKAGHKLHTPNHRKTSRTRYRLTHGSRRRSFPPPVLPPSGATRVSPKNHAQQKPSKENDPCNAGQRKSFAFGNQSEDPKAFNMCSHDGLQHSHARRRRRGGFAFGAKTREGVRVYIVKLKNNRYTEK